LVVNALNRKLYALFANYYQNQPRQRKVQQYLKEPIKEKAAAVTLKRSSCVLLEKILQSLT
jgi:hypothetical protein